MTPIKTSNGNMCIGSVKFLLLVRKKLEKLSLVFQNCFLIFQHYLHPLKRLPTTSLTSATPLLLWACHSDPLHWECLPGDPLWFPLEWLEALLLQVSNVYFILWNDYNYLCNVWGIFSKVHVQLEGNNF